MNDKMMPSRDSRKPMFGSPGRKRAYNHREQGDLFRTNCDGAARDKQHRQALVAKLRALCSDSENR
jgi:hypothetical protein